VDHHFAIVSTSLQSRMRLQTDDIKPLLTGAYSVEHPMYAGAILTMYRDVALAGIVRWQRSFRADY